MAELEEKDTRQWGRFKRASHLMRAVFQEWAIVAEEGRARRLRLVAACRYKVEVVDQRLMRRVLRIWRLETFRTSVFKRIFYAWREFAQVKCRIRKMLHAWALVVIEVSFSCSTKLGKADFG